MRLERWSSIGSFPATSALLFLCKCFTEGSCFQLVWFAGWWRLYGGTKGVNMAIYGGGAIMVNGQSQTVRARWRSDVWAAQKQNSQSIGVWISFRHCRNAGLCCLFASRVMQLVYRRLLTAWCWIIGCFRVWMFYWFKHEKFVQCIRKNAWNGLYIISFCDENY